MTALACRSLAAQPERPRVPIRSSPSLCPEPVQSRPESCSILTSICLAVLSSLSAGLGDQNPNQTQRPTVLKTQAVFPLLSGSCFQSQSTSAQGFLTGGGAMAETPRGFRGAESTDAHKSSTISYEEQIRVMEFGLSTALF